MSRITIRPLFLACDHEITPDSHGWSSFPPTKQLAMLDHLQQLFPIWKCTFCGSYGIFPQDHVMFQQRGSCVSILAIGITAMAAEIIIGWKRCVDDQWMMEVFSIFWEWHVKGGPWLCLPSYCEWGYWVAQKTHSSTVLRGFWSLVSSDGPAGEASLILLGKWIKTSILLVY